jgi:hypothetical protein
MSLKRIYGGLWFLFGFVLFLMGLCPKPRDISRRDGLMVTLGFVLGHCLLYA